MAVTKVELALARLRAFEPVRKTVLGRKEPLTEVLGKLMRLAATFAKALTVAGLGDELRRRADAFGQLIGEGSEFDNRRRAAHVRLNEAGKNFFLPDWSATRWWSQSPVAVLDQNGQPTEEFSHYSRPPNYLSKVVDRWDDCERTRWDMPGALKDVEAVLGLKWEARDKQVFEEWRRALWDVIVSSDSEHLFGSYLLAACQDAVAPGTSSVDDHESLLNRLADDPARFSRVMKDAAQDLLLSDGQPPSEMPSSPAPRNNWCHSKDEPVPVEFSLGPLAGTLLRLTGLICPFYDKEADPRALKRLGTVEAIWIQKVTGQCYKVFFPDKDRLLFSKVNAQDISEKKQKEAEKLQNETK